jgi:hypothetical protein
MSIEICRWKHGYTFAYSITYDEGFVDLIDHALPVHQEYGIPGHLVMVAGQLGEIRDVPSSTYHGVYRHLSAEQLCDLLQEGWSIGDHSMTHGDLNVNTYVEVVESKKVLKEAIGRSVTLFHLPGGDFTFASAARYLEQAGFLGVFFIDDRVNSYDPDLFALSRTGLYVEEGQPDYALFDPFPRVYDPYHRLHEALDTGGWIVDMTHLVAPKPIAPWKDTTPEILDARFDCLRRVGNGREWAAEPEEIVDYILLRRAASIQEVQTESASIAFLLRLGSVPAAVRCRDISVTVKLNMAIPLPAVLVDGKEATTTDSFVGRYLTFTWEAKDGQLVELRQAEFTP